ncbi:hypothetical protein [Algiphilus aromaticivorans]|uniref:hypothetical protein n=1 Tax=Algiphilus aromaticivorans TaxID=382454 RepID=UPI0018DCC0E9|nr:hypothetical protein [Algiphilus aromaticivorans]
MGNFLTKSRLLGLGAALGAAFALQPAAAQIEVSDSNTGTAVVVPYYTVNGGWRTLINLTNTSDNSLAVKFRLHESRNSRDVLDFNIALSPRDVWTAFIEQSPMGRPSLQTTDRSCTIPIGVRDNGAEASELAYSNEFADHTATDGDMTRTREGYIEILVMGETEGNGEALNNAQRNSTAYLAEHVDGEPRDCGRVQLDFVRRTAQFEGDDPNETISGQDAGGVQVGSGSPLARLGSVDGGGANESTIGYGPIVTPDPLKVNASLVNQDTGRAAGIESLHIAGFGVDANLVTAQQFPWFLEPTIASSDGLWSTSALPAIGAGIASSQVKNEWTSNDNTGGTAEWVVTFPTKRFQADFDNDNVQAACNAWRNDTGTVGGVSANPVVAGDCPDEGFPTVFQDGDNGRADIVAQYDIYDREEGTAQVQVDGPIVSPAPPPDIEIDNLPYESNVIRIGRNASSAASTLESPVALAVDTNQLVSNADSGWLEMTFIDDDMVTAYPVTGFVYKQRDFGNPGLNFGQATEHAYTIDN